MKERERDRDMIGGASRTKHILQWKAIKFHIRSNEWIFIMWKSEERERERVKLSQPTNICGGDYEWIMWNIYINLVISEFECKYDACKCICVYVDYYSLNGNV